MTESAPGQLTRQQLYDRIRETSKEETILKEMKRLGFWPEGAAEPRASEQIINRIAELEREMRSLVMKRQRVSDPDKALKDMRKQRMVDSRKRSKETKLRNMQACIDRALNWYEKNKTEIFYLGEKVSAGLSQTVSDHAKLTKFKLPILDNALQLADAMGISLSELRFLSYSREVSRVHHYHQFEIPKKTGGTRKISTPMPRLKRVQYWLLDNILSEIPLHDAAHGFVAKKSIVSNAQAHLQSAIIINFDLKDFFPTITYKRIKGYCHKLGYSEQLASIIGLLCSEHSVDEIELDGDLFYVSKGERRLPQGAPTSPAISNLICYRLDKRLHGAVKDLGFSYTRYADDMTFSSKVADDNALKKLFWRVHQIIGDEGFVVHPDKTRIMRKGSCQEVTGIVVNEKQGINRKVVRRFKACLHQAKLDGIDQKQWGSSHNFMSAIHGFASYIHMVDPEKGKRFLQQVAEIRQLHASNIDGTKSIADKQFRLKSAQGEVPLDKWWIPAVKSEPELIKPLIEEIEKEKTAKIREKSSEKTKKQTANRACEIDLEVAPGKIGDKRNLLILFLSGIILLVGYVSFKLLLGLMILMVVGFIAYLYNLKDGDE